MSRSVTFSAHNLRQLFLNYFAQQQHAIVPSSSLIPAADPTLFFTNAGMVQFKDTFLGTEKRPYKRATSVQRCMRVSGKHNDLDNVGYTARHHTFFEMLGNFSFGDYFKREAIRFAWNFLTHELKIDAQKLWVTVHQNDKEAATLWQEEFKNSQLQPQGFSYCGDKDNFWSMGETGPCGYCSEIYFDHGAEFPGCPPGQEGEDGDRYVEIWNLVFMQFDRDQEGNLTALPKPSVDTGMGLERLAAVMQGVHSNYDIDLFQKLIGPQSDVVKLWKLTPVILTEHRTALHVIADHIRAIAFLIMDGVIPSNEGRGYVLRRIIRRAVRHLRQIKVAPAHGHIVSLCDLLNPLINVMGEAYPELANAKATIERLLRYEETLFLETLDNGLKHFNDAIAKLTSKEIHGEVVFYLYDTYGFPVDLTAEMAKERSLTIDMAGFTKFMQEQRQKSRNASKCATAGELKLDLTGETEFVGYEHVTGTSQVNAIFNQHGERVTTLKFGEEGIVVLNKTPFYAESGGQIGDTGELTQDGKCIFEVKDTKKHGALYLHCGKIMKGELHQDTNVKAEINTIRRQAIRCNHSATHLLHKALRIVLGSHAEQRGSAVDDTRLRFDFTHFAAVTNNELQEIERIVNAKIRATLKVSTAIKTLEQAKSEGATALFGEKYGTDVRVVTMNDFSQELCGGTHVKNTGEIGMFKIVAETGVAAGVRRIEAVTAANALQWINQAEDSLQNATLLFNCAPEQLAGKIKQLVEDKRVLEKELVKLKNAAALNKGKDLTSQIVMLDNIKVLAAKLENVDMQALRQTLDNLKQNLGVFVVLLASVVADKINLVAGVSKDLTGKINAGELVKHVAAQLGGSGGGRPDMAQGGGVNLEALPNALQSALPWIKEKL